LELFQTVCALGLLELYIIFVVEREPPRDIVQVSTGEVCVNARRSGARADGALKQDD
jgi:hypothetical protein